MHHPPHDLSKHYRVLSKLGEGGMAHVYLAISQGMAGFSKLVVLKILKQELAKNPELRDGFLREARVSARMGHPNVVAVNAVEEHAGVPVIVMEYLQGQSLSAIQRRFHCQVPLAFHLRILSDSLSGLHYAHELTDFDGKKLNLVHRDFTPQNVFVTYDGSVKVLDFGIAQVTRQPSDAKRDIVKGKLRYMAPEQIVADPLDRRADVFAAGILLSEAVTGRRFWGDLSDAEVVKRILARNIPSPRDLDPSCPIELDRICRSALMFERESRYPTIAALQQELEAFIAARSTRVSTQELGRELSSWFERERHDAVEVIESTLSDERYVSWTSIPLSHQESTRSHTPPAAIAEPATVLDRKSWYARQQHGSRRMLLAVPTVALTVISLVAALRYQSNVAQPASAVSSVLAPASARVKVSVTAMPSTARIFLDDDPVGQNPFVREVDVDSNLHVLRVRAPGFRSVEQRHPFDKNFELVVQLEAEDLAAPAVDAKPRPERAVAAAPRPAAVPLVAKRDKPPARPACSPPFSIDSHGFKHFKPECM
jgi:serine/threonine-protein kinase